MWRMGKRVVGVKQEVVCVCVLTIRCMGEIADEFTINEEQDIRAATWYWSKIGQNTIRVDGRS